MAADPRLEEHRRVWDAKPSLRLIYADYYRRMAEFCRAGRTLEIGSGSGHLPLPPAQRPGMLQVAGRGAGRCRQATIRKRRP